jgi:hypothetical protein
VREAVCEAVLANERDGCIGEFRCGKWGGIALRRGGSAWGRGANGGPLPQPLPTLLPPLRRRLQRMAAKRAAAADDDDDDDDDCERRAPASLAPPAPSCARAQRAAVRAVATPLPR